MIKKLFFILCMLWSVANAQCDSVTVHTVTNVTSTTAQLNWIAPAGATSYFIGVYNFNTNVLIYTASTTATFKVITGLVQGTKYKAFVYVFCAVGPPAGVIDIFVPTHIWTTVSNATVYTPQKSTQFTYLKGDSMFNLPRVDTNLNRAPNIGGAMVWRPQDSTFYGYNGLRWMPMGTDSLGVIALINKKVDSVTVVGDSLFYWINGVSRGYVFPTATSVAWSLTGNAGTTAGTNFIGTIDEQPLIFKVGNTLAGSIGTAPVTDNLSLGIGSLPYLSGNTNTAFGTGSIRNNSTGAENTAVGSNSLNSNSTGGGNNAFGNSALANLTTGGSNTGVGSSTGLTVTIGNNNTFLGVVSDASGNNFTNATAIGANAYVGASNTMVLGSIAGINAATNSTKVVIGGTTSTSGYPFEVQGSSRVWGTFEVGGDHYLDGIPSSHNATDSMLVMNASDRKVGFRPIPSGGGITGTLTANRFVYSTGAGTVTTNANATFDGNDAVFARDIYVNGQTIGTGNNTATANKNTVHGSQSGIGLSSGQNNSFFGWGAGAAISAGNGNTGIGTYSLNSTTSSTNTAIGYASGYSNVTGADNVYIGNECGLFATNSKNTAIGYQAARSLLGGFSNAVFGYQTGYSMTSAFWNSIFGAAAGINIIDGQQNTTMGHNSLYNTTSGSFNVAMGDSAGGNNILGNYNIFLGFNAKGTNPNASGQLVIGDVNYGYKIIGDSSNKLRFPAYGAGAATFDASGNITSVQMFISDATTSEYTTVGLNTAYPNVPVGFQVICSAITGPGVPTVYIKSTEAGSSDVWIALAGILP